MMASHEDSEEHKRTFCKSPSTTLLTSFPPELVHVPTFEPVSGKSYELRQASVISGLGLSFSEEYGREFLS